MRSLTSFLAILFLTFFQTVLSEGLNWELVRLVANRKLLDKMDFQNQIKALKDNKNNHFTKNDIDYALTALGSKTWNVRDISLVPKHALSRKHWKNDDRPMGKAEHAESILSLAPEGYRMSDGAAKALYKRNNIAHNAKAVAGGVGKGAILAGPGAAFTAAVGAAVGAAGGPVGAAIGAGVFGFPGVAVGAAIGKDYIKEKWVGKKDHNAVKTLIQQHGGNLPAKKPSMAQKMKSYFSNLGKGRVFTAARSK